MTKRRRASPLLPDAGAPGSPESLWVGGDCKTVGEYQRIVSSPDPAPISDGRTSRPHGQNGPTMTYSGCLITKVVDDEEVAGAVCMEGYVQRILSHLAPGICPEVRWIRKPVDDEGTPSITMQAGADVSKRDFGLSMIVQIADRLQLLAVGAQFRHGDLHWGNVVRVKRRVMRRRRNGNAIRPCGEWSVPLWYNLSDTHCYEIIDFGMSSLALQVEGDTVQLDVPNEFYGADTVADDQHDLRCLITTMWQTIWIHKSYARGQMGTTLKKRTRGNNHYSEWFPWLLDCIVRRAAETCPDYALAVDVDTHAVLARHLRALRGQSPGAVRELLRGKPRLRALYNLCPSQWERVWVVSDEGRYVDHIPLAHCLYECFIGRDTPIFAPQNVVAVCCWVNWHHSQAWFSGRRQRNHVYEYSEFSRFCADNNM